MENVGGAELIVCSIAGPAPLTAGLTVLGARHGKPAGLVAATGGGSAGR